MAGLGSPGRHRDPRSLRPGLGVQEVVRRQSRWWVL